MKLPMNPAGAAAWRGFTAMSINGIVLAGGLSSRMGRDKALLPWHGRTVLEHMRGCCCRRAPGGRG